MQRWVHLDPCEAAYDTPHLYEVGLRLVIEPVTAAPSNMSEALLHGLSLTRILVMHLSLPRDCRVALQAFGRWDY